MALPIPPRPFLLSDGHAMDEELYCYQCPLLPFSSICTGFRELLMLATAGKKSDSTVCSKCQALSACLNGCTLMTIGNSGMKQLYSRVQQKR